MAGGNVWHCIKYPFSCMKDKFLSYETLKIEVKKDCDIVYINRVLQLLLIIGFSWWLFAHEKAYQSTDTGIESAVKTKVKGVGFYNNKVMDVADYVLPRQGTDVFCIITRLFETKNQTQGTCAQYGEKYQCSTNADCFKHLGCRYVKGFFTGTCLTEVGQCEVRAWCPTEDESSRSTEFMEEAENFTIFIRNTVHFPNYGVTRGNIPPNINLSCTFDAVANPYCPIFRVGDILHYANENFSTVAEQGGQIGIHIRWNCNFDEPVENCLPSYSFTKLSDVFLQNNLSKGFNFRFAKYYRTTLQNTTIDSRYLYKAFAINFHVMVSGKAGKFDIIPTLINIVLAFQSLHVVTESKPQISKSLSTKLYSGYQLQCF
ncbi:P2X purinoceptor 3-like isoform X2 [Engraulis encrasicolus]|uniref:P2X purinoceptor 3-like isoform X2 n=1 Tax=Engraulis encrasicolus TaxID=184585 RepID=UPI002FCEB13E